MTLEEVIAEVQRRGFIIAVSDGKPRLIGVASDITPELRAGLAEHREALIEKYSPVPPRRVVLLAGGRDSEVERMLEQMSAQEGIKRARALGQLYRGRTVALEWLSDLGWVRFTWISYPVEETKHEQAAAVA